MPSSITGGIRICSYIFVMIAIVFCGKVWIVLSNSGLASLQPGLLDL